ncbi:MAG: hypothetical protein ACYCP0_05415 [Acidiferrobacteraceae bacterium]
MTDPGTAVMEPEGVRPLKTVSKSVDAQCYNKIRLALLRLPYPVRVELPRLRLEMVLERDCWMARSLINGVPMLSWTGFDNRGRALHEAVSCQVHLYHVHAGLLMGNALEHLCAALDKALSRAARQTRSEGG